MNSARSLSQRTPNASLVSTPGKHKKQHNHELVAPYVPSNKTKNPKIKNKLSKVSTKEFDLSLSPKREIKIDITELSDLIYEATTERETVENTIKYLKIYQEEFKIAYNQYGQIVRLAHAVKKSGQLDILFMILALAAKNVISALKVPNVALDKLLQHAKWLLNQTFKFTIFNGDQVTPRMHIREMIDIFSARLGSHFTFETSELSLLDDVSSIAISDCEDFNANIEVFLLARDLDALIAEGKGLFNSLLKDDQSYYLDMARKFNEWPTAYSQSYDVWKLMKVDRKFNVCILLSLINYLFAKFIVIGLHQFAIDEGMVGDINAHTLQHIHTDGTK